MPCRCSVYGCKSNYDSQKEKVTTFSLPKQEPLRGQWLKKIPTDLSKLKKPFVCIKHFEESSIIRTDTVRVRGETKVYPRIIPKLVKDAVPCIFANAPKYLSSVSKPSRRLVDAEKENLKRALAESLNDHQAYLQNDSITNLCDIKQFFEKKYGMNDKWTMLVNDKKITLCLFNTFKEVPDLLANISVQENLNCSVYSKKIKLRKISNLNVVCVLKSFNVLEELMRAIEENVKNVDFIKDSHKDVIDTAINTIKEHPEFETSNFLNFFVEQLSLFNVSDTCRRYNNKTIILSSNLYVQSPSAYRTLYNSKCLIIPHPRNLQKLIYNFSLPGSHIHDSINYLKTRIKFLKPHEMLVNLQLDEIYIQPTINFKGGTVYGTSVFDSNKAAKTAQVFMLSSIFSQYRDVVCIIPVTGLSGEKLKEMIIPILNEVENIGFKILALVSDNNGVNRQAFQLFTPDQILTSSIIHPLDSSRKLFLLFDTVHILKSVRNNWERKKNSGRSLLFPNFDNFDVSEIASYKHLELMYDIEKNSIVKYGHLLSYKVLYPSNISKQNVNLALKLLNEKNIVALQHIAKDHPTEFENVNGTVNFITIFVKWWKIVNVKSVFEDIRFNDIFRSAIKPDETRQIEFLNKMCIWLKKWKTSVPSEFTLSSQTFQALISTNEAFLELIPYVFKNYKPSYILLSKFQTDSLESRFSTYRQLSGSNYYISYVQVLENERKVRFRNTVLLASSNINITLKSLIPYKEPLHNSVDINDFSEVLNEEFDFEHVPKNILPILVYIGGFCSRRVLRKGSCDLCTEWLQLRKEIDISLTDLSELEGYAFLTDLDRGKLFVPTKFVVISISIVWCIMSSIIEKFYDNFLNVKDQLSILHKLSCIALSREDSISLTVFCLCNKTLKEKLEKIMLITCKILINNFVKSLSDSNLSKGNEQRKIKKLKK